MSTYLNRASLPDGCDAEALLRDVFGEEMPAGQQEASSAKGGKKKRKA